MKLELSTWTSHLNQLVYSYFYFCKKERIEINLVRNEKVKYDGGILYIGNKRIYFDYSDSPRFIDLPELYDFYFKRSLRIEDHKNNVYPLNFNTSLSYNSHLLLMNLKTDILFHKYSRTEVIRAIDRFSLFVNASHKVVDIKRYPTKVHDSGGNVIFYARLWNPDNHKDEEEKERRRLQNEFRINACRILKKKYKQAAVGLFNDSLAITMAPDLILNKKQSNKNNYFEILNNSNICIADDGLKDTPGWKIGEYLLFGKAVVTTPLNISVDNFNEHVNFEKLSNRNAYEELPQKIDYLLENKKYLRMGEENLLWSEKYLHPKNYIKRILTIVENKTKIEVN